jgi:cell division protein FtsI (penicillin-binding protein 3)
MQSRSKFGRRLKVVGLLCFLAAAALVVKMYRITVVAGAELSRQARSITCRDSVETAYRGQIVDRNGAALATSMESFQVAVRRGEYVYDASDAARLATALKLDRGTLDKTLRSDPRKFIWLSRRVDTDAANEIRGLRIAGIDVVADQLRAYPHGSLAAHVIGFSGIDEQGMEGIERVLDEEIRGESITRKVCKDARGRVWLDRGGLPGMNQGATVELTIDATLQSLAEAELARQIDEMDADGGSVVMLDPRSGEILAMANAPTFDPNRYSAFGPDKRRNRAVTDTFEPGSTMKPFVVAAALDTGVIRESDRFDCENGFMRIGGWPIRDHHPYKILNVSEIIQVSSNICSAKIGAKLGADKLYDYLKSFGFARPTGVETPGEVIGRLSPPSEWKQVKLANISFGQGVTVTAVQLAAAMGTLANNGVRMLPYVVRRVTDLDGDVLRYRLPETEGRVIAPEVARKVSDMMELVIGPGGTAERAAIAGVRVAGKTGTAQKVENGRYSTDHWLSSFAGFLPADDPRLVIVVVIDEPREHHYGGVVAAPVFQRIAEASLDYLHVHRPAVAEPELINASLPPPPPALPQPTAVTKFNGKMPELRGLSLRAAMRAMNGCDCAVDVAGSGYVVKQRPDPGVDVTRDARVTVELARAAAE